MIFSASEAKNSYQMENPHCFSGFLDAIQHSHTRAKKQISDIFLNCQPSMLITKLSLSQKLFITPKPHLRQAQGRPKGRCATFLFSGKSTLVDPIVIGIGVMIMERTFKTA
jgi:hypothetical protein